MDKRNIIFFDIDGTIMDDAWYIPPSAIEAIAAARAKGNICVLNTGRPYTHIEPSVIEVGFDGCICSCGQLIMLDGKQVFRAKVDGAVCAEIVRLAECCRLDAYYEAEESMRSVMLHPRNRGMQNYLDRMIERGFQVELDPREPGYVFDKFCVWAHEDSDIAAFAEYAEKYYTMINRGGGMYECILRGYSKETGIAAVLERLGISMERSYAIGDSANDLPMLKCVAHGIAMGNAPDSVKAQVEYVTDDISRDGLAKALEHYNLV